MVGFSMNRKDERIESLMRSDKGRKNVSGKGIKPYVGEDNFAKMHEVTWGFYSKGLNIFFNF
jgi:hypothetical protein